MGAAPTLCGCVFGVQRQRGKCRDRVHRTRSGGDLFKGSPRRPRRSGRTKAPGAAGVGFRGRPTFATRAGSGDARAGGSRSRGRPGHPRDRRAGDRTRPRRPQPAVARRRSAGGGAGRALRPSVLRGQRRQRRPRWPRRGWAPGGARARALRHARHGHRRRDRADGRLFIGGTRGYAGEIGHIQVEPDGVPLRLRLVGMRRDVRRRAGLGAARGEGLAARRVHPARDCGSIPRSSWRPRAPATRSRSRWWTARRARWARASAATLNLLNLERVVIAGGVAAAGAFLLDRVVEETRKRIFPHVFADCSFRLAELGARRGRRRRGARRDAGAGSG